MQLAKVHSKNEKLLQKTTLLSYTLNGLFNSSILITKLMQ